MKGFQRWIEGSRIKIELTGSTGSNLRNSLFIGRARYAQKNRLGPRGRHPARMPGRQGSTPGKCLSCRSARNVCIAGSILSSFLPPSGAAVSRSSRSEKEILSPGILPKVRGRSTENLENRTTPAQDRLYGLRLSFFYRGNHRF